MNPLGGNPSENLKSEPVKNVEAAPPAVATASEPVNPPIAETRAFSANAATNEPKETEENFDASGPHVEEPVAETKPLEPVETITAAKASDELYQSTYSQSAKPAAANRAPYYVPDTGYSPTIVVEKNVKQRNSLLLGLFVIGCALMVGSYVYSMFNKFLDIAAIDTPNLLSYIGEVEPPPMEIEEEEKPPAPKDDDDGGGGGGGRDEPTPASKGREAAQVKDPLFAPSVTYTKVTNPDIAIQAATKNKNERPAENSDLPYGLKNGADGLSDGMGTGGGQGSGRGRGQGSGNGDGYGLGNGSGRGSGNGDGEGDGDGDSDGSRIVVKKPPVGPTEGVKILSKPRANYTDAARQAQVQGKVVLRVTFSANGSIGAISVISGLGNGLTEQAIAAARGIRFEPAKKAGVPVSVSKPVEYSFTIY
ncbi:MAG TPA: energy transducer TonB [Pyrinomonadaceae bacterium]